MSHPQGGKIKEGRENKGTFMKKFIIPADVPHSARTLFENNYYALTQQTDNLFLFAADQKIEHLNDDFFGSGIDSAANDPHHIFEIAQKAPIGALAAPLGFLNRYAHEYKDINYVAKLNGKTNLVPSSQADPSSELLWSIADVVQVRQNSNITICGVGYTLYPGSAHESLMLKQAAQIVTQAHEHGLVAILWIYPRGKAITKYDAKLFIGAAGLANALGADFVKLAIPHPIMNYNELAPAVQAAGNTKIICSGGPSLPVEELLHAIDLQQKLGFNGVAIGRNLFQRSRDEAVKLAESIEKILK